VRSSLGFSVTPAGQTFNPTKLTEGSWPHLDEIVIDKGTASGNGFNVGDQIAVQAFGPQRKLQISGIAEFPGVSVGGASFGILDQPAAQQLFHKEASSTASVSGRSRACRTPSSSPRYSPALPEQVVRTGEAQARRTNTTRSVASSGSCATRCSRSRGALSSAHS
jgi:hypothetical protein